MEILNASIEPLMNWSRAQFAMTAMYHWLFVPLTLGLGVIMAIMETMYVRTGNEEWKKTAKFWMNIFGVNFAIGVATGLILEFQFGTNWSNYSWFVGDIFGAPLAIEAILAFFMEATFISIMFFGWQRVSKKVHLTATWLTIVGATLSAVWILIANAWMQNPVGMEFNPDTSRNEMVDFMAVALSPTAINKFIHTLMSCWILGAVFVMGVASWYVIKKRNLNFARQSMKVAAIFGLVASLLTLSSGHTSSQLVAEQQPMKLAVMEGLYEGSKGEGIVAFGVPTPGKKWNDDKDPYLFDIKIPYALSLLSFSDVDAFVPGIKDIVEGGYVNQKGDTALSFAEKQARGRTAIEALGKYRIAKKEGNETVAAQYKDVLQENYNFFGYGYLDKPEDIIPNVSIVFWAYHIMVYAGGFFILIFILALFFRKKLESMKWMLWTMIFAVPVAYLAGQAGWVVAEVGRYPWTVQDALPIQAALSAVSSTSVQITFFLFLTLFTALLVAEIRIMLNQIKKGPQED